MSFDDGSGNEETDWAWELAKVIGSPLKCWCIQRTRHLPELPALRIAIATLVILHGCNESGLKARLSFWETGDSTIWAWIRNATSSIPPHCPVFPQGARTRSLVVTLLAVVSVTAGAVVWLV